MLVTGSASGPPRIRGPPKGGPVAGRASRRTLSPEVTESFCRVPSRQFAQRLGILYQQTSVGLGYGWIQGSAKAPNGAPPAHWIGVDPPPPPLLERGGGGDDLLDGVFLSAWTTIILFNQSLKLMIEQSIHPIKIDCLISPALSGLTLEAVT